MATDSCSHLDGPLLDALIERISQLLGPPVGVTKKMYRWRKDAFEVAVDAQNGPSVWLSARWTMNHGLPGGLRNSYYQAGRARHSNLNGDVPSLADGDAYHIFPDPAQLELTLTSIRECARNGGAL